MKAAVCLVMGTAVLSGCAGGPRSSLDEGPFAESPPVVLEAGSVAAWSQGVIGHLSMPEAAPLVSGVASSSDGTITVALSAEALFVPHSAQLRTTAMVGVADLASVIARHPGAVIHVVVAGAADADLAPEIRLAARRATALAAELSRDRLPARRLRTESRSGVAGTADAVWLVLRPVVAGRQAQAWARPVLAGS